MFFQRQRLQRPEIIFLLRYAMNKYIFKGTFGYISQSLLSRYPLDGDD